VFSGFHHGRRLASEESVLANVHVEGLDAAKLKEEIHAEIDRRFTLGQGVRAFTDEVGFTRSGRGMSEKCSGERRRKARHYLTTRAEEHRFDPSKRRVIAK
jgi:hypothetical protein